MKNAIKLLSALVALIIAVPSLAWVGTADLGTFDPGDELAPYNQTGVRTLSPDTLYSIYGLYYVENGATINIPAGTVIKGEPACDADRQARRPDLRRRHRDHADHHDQQRGPRQPLPRRLGRRGDPGPRPGQPRQHP